MRASLFLLFARVCAATTVHFAGSGVDFMYQVNLANARRERWSHFSGWSGGSAAALYCCRRSRTTMPRALSDIRAVLKIADAYDLGCLRHNLTIWVTRNGKATPLTGFNSAEDAFDAAESSSNVFFNRRFKDVDPAWNWSSLLYFLALEPLRIRGNASRCAGNIAPRTMDRLYATLPKPIDIVGSGRPSAIGIVAGVKSMLRIFTSFRADRPRDYVPFVGEFREEDCLTPRPLVRCDAPSQRCVV